MKNQYFGDVRDLFKYDLVLEMLMRLPINHFTFIPMLTPDGEDVGGRRTNYANWKAGSRMNDLKKFLSNCVKRNRRNIMELKKFFKSFKESHLTNKDLRLTIYRKGEYFSDDGRELYFSGIQQSLLRNSVVLVDPDIGLEVKSAKSKGEKYVKYEEVRYLFNRMDKSSVLVIFQFIPRVRREKYLPQLLDRVKNQVRGSSTYYITDNQVAFFILTKGPDFQKRIRSILSNYSRAHGLTWGGG